MSPFLSDLISAASLTYQLENVRDARKQNHAEGVHLSAATEKLRKAIFVIVKTWASDSTANVRRHINEELFEELFRDAGRELFSESVAIEGFRSGAASIKKA
ncbi:MAG TPA: hypothetical protein VH592_26440 [Gemmataceae bacterium]